VGELLGLTRQDRRARAGHAVGARSGPPRTGCPTRRSAESASWPASGCTSSGLSLGLIDDLEIQIAQLTVQLERQGGDQRYIPVLVAAPNIASGLHRPDARSCCRARR
jgi:hypothetical protein